MTVEEFILVLSHFPQDANILVTFDGTFIKPHDLYVSKDGTVLLDVEGSIGREKEYKEIGIPTRFRLPKSDEPNKSKPASTKETKP